MFLIKKIVAPLFSPLSVIVGLMGVGLFLIWFTKKQKMGKILITIGTLLLFLFSYDAVPNHLLKPLEQRFPPIMLDSRANAAIDTSSVKWVVLLGGGHTMDRNLPVTSELSEESLVRLIESIRIYKKIPGSKIILSGGAVFDRYPEAETLSRAAQIMNVPASDIVLDNDSRDTEEQAVRIRSLVNNDRFILVTSAYHMPRSVALFNKAGLHPIPAPTNHMVLKKKYIRPNDFYPSSSALQKTERAIHEYLGLVWSKVRNKV
jgi:uncharacterized SAM-binding protein YcdF (DUF218 family)